MTPMFSESGTLCGCVLSSVLRVVDVFGLFSCNRSNIGCGIVMGPGCFPLMPFTLDCRNGNADSDDNANGNDGTVPFTL